MTSRNTIALLLSGLLATALPTAAFAQAKVQNLPAQVPSTGLVYGTPGSTATSVDAAHPLPVAAPYQALTLLTAATSAGTLSPNPATYNLQLPSAFNGATITVTMTTANGAVSTFPYTATPAVTPCFHTSSGTTVSAAASGGTPTGNTIFAANTRCGGGDVSPVAVTQGALVASGKIAVTGTFTATGTSAAFSPIAGRPFNVTISSGVAVCEVDRSFDSGSTWFAVITDSIRTAIPESFTLTETETGVQYRANCTAYTSGTVTYRLSM